VTLATTIKRFLPLIHNTLDHGVSNALSEATNTHLRLLTRRAYAVDPAHPYPDDHDHATHGNSRRPKDVDASRGTLAGG
jgi:hypothetical protein